MSNQYFIYILTNKNDTTLYIGVTNNLERRIIEHKKRLIKGFSQKYKLTKLIYYESCPSINDAIAREKQLKNWHRDWKINLIKTTNPNMNDLGKELDSEINSE